MRRILLAGFLGAGLLASSCSSGFGTAVPRGALIVTFPADKNGMPQNLGTPENRLPIVFTPQAPFVIRIEAHRADGSIDTSFNSWVRLSSKPGTVYSVADGGRNVQLQNGVVDQVSLPLVAAYGDARIWAEDLGYVPVSNLERNPPPQCSDGVDNDGDGKVDFPTDPGCFSSNDDSETEGTLATGVSPIVHYGLPRIADVRGITLSSGTATAFPGEQVFVDTGYNDSSDQFAFDVVVTRIASDGFYMTDVQDQQSRGFASVFAFTFSSPTLLRVCDRMKVFAGSASDFFGFTELNNPAWSVEYYDPAARPCLVPEPITFTANSLAPTDPSGNSRPSKYADTVPPLRPNGRWVDTLVLGEPAQLFQYESALVSIVADGDPTSAPGDVVTLHIGSHIGSKHPAAPDYAPTADATNCDLNDSGKIDFSDANENACNTACDNDNECSEYTSFGSQSQFTLVVTTATAASSRTVKVLADGSSAPGFDPVLTKGQPLKAFTGTFRYFSGGTQWTIEARCGDDIVTDLTAQPMSSSTACVRQRTSRELQGN